MKNLSYDVKTIRLLDYFTINTIGIPSAVLMDHAGKGTFDSIVSYFPNNLLKKGISVLCGAGNNGGDGFVVARFLSQANIPVSVYLFANPSRLSAESLLNYNIIQKLNVKITVVESSKDWNSVRDEALSVGCIVDALFGTGIKNILTDFFKNIIDDINFSNKKIVSIDIPSGINGNTGMPMGNAVKSNLTVTYGAIKIGCLMDPAIPFIGKLKCIDIGLATKEFSFDQAIKVEVLNKKVLQSLMPSRLKNAHKNSFGHILIIAGSKGKVGAALLTARAALKTGVGLITLAAPKSVFASINNIPDEIMTNSLDEDNDGCISDKAINAIMDLTKNKAAIAIGPGLGISKELKDVLLEVIKNTASIPKVVDADALNIISMYNSEFKHLLNDNIIITPHPKEAERLLVGTNIKIQENRYQSAKLLHEEYNCISVLKGANTLIYANSCHVYANTKGSSAMSSAGMGDVLTGVIGGFLAQKTNAIESSHAIESSKLGVYIHALAGDLAKKHLKQRYVSATDVISFLPMAVTKTSKK